MTATPNPHATLGAPAPTVPVKVTEPPPAQEGAAVALAGWIEPAAGPVNVVTLSYGDPTDWQNPPATVNTTVAANGRRTFTVQLISRVKNAAAQRTTTVSVSTPTASATANIRLTPHP